MVLHEYWAFWPADVTIGEASDRVTVPPNADLSDIVVNVQNQCPGQLRVKLRRSKYSEYTVIMPVPPAQQQKIILNIIRKTNMTLHELGELPIS